MLLQNITFAPDEEQFLADMRLKPGSGRRAACLELIHEAIAIARPRAVWVKKTIGQLDKDGITVDNMRLESSLFAPLLKEGQDIYLFLVTAGQEISEWSNNYNKDMVKHYWADALTERAMRMALGLLEEELSGIIGGEHLAFLDPGSLPAWPIEQQQPLFELLGEAAHDCGVSLSEYCVMRPQKSVSGFYFASDVEYSNCAQCPRLRCPSRKAEFQG